MQLLENDIPECRRRLKESHANLEKVASYCEGNYLQVMTEKMGKMRMLMQLALMLTSNNGPNFNPMHSLLAPGPIHSLALSLPRVKCPGNFRSQAYLFP